MSAPTVSHDYVGDRSPKPATRTKPSPLFRAVQAVASLRLTVPASSPLSGR